MIAEPLAVEDDEKYVGGNPCDEKSSSRPSRRHLIVQGPPAAMARARQH